MAQERVHCCFFFVRAFRRLFSFQLEEFMNLRWMCASLLVIALTPTVQPQAKPEPPSMLGYSGQSIPGQKEWEKKFQDAIVPANIKESMRRLSARPHHVGSPYDKDNAEWMLSKFKEWGFDAQIETFNV